METWHTIGEILCRTITQSEAEFILKWLDSNRAGREEYPGNVIYPRLQRMLEDNLLDDDEELELLTLLMDITGGAQTFNKPISNSTTLPLSDPMPEITYKNKAFVITGTLLKYKRSEAKEVIENLGGKVVGAPSSLTDYLIIAQLGSKDWMHSTHGRKIEKAVKLRDEDNAKIAIISEKHWLDSFNIKNI